MDYQDKVKMSYTFKVTGKIGTRLGARVLPRWKATCHDGVHAVC